jgi:hypothetical protein
VNPETKGLENNEKIGKSKIAEVIERNDEQEPT